MLSKLDINFWELSQHQWWLSPGNSMITAARNTGDVQVTGVAVISECVCVYGVCLVRLLQHVTWECCFAAMMLMDIDNEMIDFTIKYSVFHWHSLESYRHFQNLAEYKTYVAFLYCIYQCNILSALIPVGSDKTFLDFSQLLLPQFRWAATSICPLQPGYIQTYTLEPLRWIQQVLQAPVGLCCMMQVHVCTCRDKV